MPISRPRCYGQSLRNSGRFRWCLHRTPPLATPWLTQDRAALDQLNHKLEGLATGTQAAVIYVIGRHGVAVAASNWREPGSFVGNDYRFREYYQKAISSGKAEHFALGSVSKKPGLYISQRVDGASGPLGVVVVKLEFDPVEAAWAASQKPTYVTDRRGIVLITSIPSWRFMTIGEIPANALCGHPREPAVRRGAAAPAAVPAGRGPGWRQPCRGGDAGKHREPPNSSI